MKSYLSIAVLGTSLLGIPMLTGCDWGKTTTEKSSETTHSDGSTSVDKTKTSTDSNGNVSKETVHQSSNPNP